MEIKNIYGNLKYLWKLKIFMENKKLNINT